MSNGTIDDAELDLLLKGTDRAIDRYVVTTLRALRTTVEDTAREVETMREICEERGRLCPGMHTNIADPVTTLAAEHPKLSRETWLMWGLGTGLLKGLALPVLVAALVVILSRVFLGV